MFKTWSCSTCCTADPNIRFHVQLCNQEAPHQTHVVSTAATQNLPSKSPKANIEQKRDSYQTPYSLNRGSTCSVLSAFDLSFYSLCVFLVNGDGDILAEQDLLYVCESDAPLPKTVFELRKPHIGYLNVDTNNRGSGSCWYSAANLMPFQSYTISYLRINAENGKVYLLGASSKFKIAIRDRSSNFNNEAPSNLPNSDYMLVFEHDLLFEKISKMSVEELCSTSAKLHCRNIKSFQDTAPPSVKTFRSSNDFSKLLERPGKRNKNSFFNSTSWFTESNMQSYNVTNKNSVLENVFYSGANHNSGLHGLTTNTKNSSSIDIRKTPINLNHRRMQSHLSKDSEPRSNSKDPETSLIMNETFVVNESRENTDYVRKMCSALDQNKPNWNSFSNYYSPMGKTDTYEQEMIPNTAHKEDANYKGESQRLHNLKTTTKKADFYKKPSAQFLSERKDNKNLFFTSKAPFLQSDDYYGEDQSDVQFDYDVNDPINTDRMSSNGNTNKNSNSSPVAASYRPKAFRRIYENDSGEKTSSPYNIVDWGRGDGVSSYFNQSYPSNKKAWNFKLNSGCEEQEGDDEVASPRNFPRGSIVGAGFGSDRKIPKSSDFSFNGRTEECTTVTNGNLQTTLESESMKATPRLTPILNGNNSQITSTDLKTILSPGERLYTVEEVTTPSKEWSTIGDYNNFRSFYSRRSLRNPHNNSARLRTSDIYAVSEINEDEDRAGQSPLKFTQMKYDSDQYGSTGGDLPIEIMVMAKKFEDLGLVCEYDSKECLFRVRDPRDSDLCFIYKWYKETLDRDLAEFFEDIREALQARANQNAQSDEYVLL